MLLRWNDIEKHNKNNYEVISFFLISKFGLIEIKRAFVALACSQRMGNKK